MDLSWQRQKKAVKAENPIKKHWATPTVELNPRDVEPYVELTVLVMNRVLTEMREIYSCADNLRSLKFALYLFVISVFGQIFSGAQILFIGVNFLFVWPKLYERQGSKIDALFSKAWKIAAKIGSIGLKFLPKKIRTWLMENDMIASDSVSQDVLSSAGVALGEKEKEDEKSIVLKKEE